MIDSARRELDAHVRGWTAEVDRVLSAVMPAGPVALTSFPNHRNAGDVALWLAAERALARLGRPPSYRCAWNGFSLSALRRRVGDGPILLNGGGNFGDLYVGQQGLREEILRTCRSNPVVQLPQSIHFQQPENLRRVQQLIGDHGQVTILCRDEVSRAFAEAHFAARVEACPDLVLTLGLAARPEAPSADVVWVARRDPEAMIRPIEADGVEVVDWLPLMPGEDERAGAPLLAWATTRASLRLFQRAPWAADRLWRIAAAGFDPVARAWVDRARRVLARGRVVVTDRLHAHILAIQMGIPTVVLDSSYGKVHNVARQSTTSVSLTHLAHDSETALRIARSLLIGSST